MDYRISKPSQILSPWIKHYWTMENCLSENTEHVQRIVPNGLVELSFYFDDVPQSLDNKINITETTNITGQLSKYFDIRIQQRLSLFSIIFQPIGMAAIFDIPMNLLHNKNIPFKYLLKEATNELETKLYEAKSFAERIKLAEIFLIKQLQRKSTQIHLPRIQRCIEIINTTQGLVNVDYLASEACLSRKQFERVFLEYIGTSPKRFMRIVKFQHAIHEKSMNQKVSLTSLSYTCGYFDQSHMTNEFIQLSGMNPKLYFSDCEPFSDYFN